MERQAQNGFTLLEVIVAISILMFGILAVASMQASSIRGNDLSISLTQGTSMAADRMEKLARLPYTDANLTSTAGTSPHSDPSPSAGFNVTWTVMDNTDANLVSDTKTVLVTVNWTEHNVPKTITLPRIFPRII